MSTEKIERLITIAERLIGALEADIAALERGAPQQMKTIDPEIQKLSALYAREAGGLNIAAAKAAPEPLRSKFTATVARFRDVLAQQTRIVTRVRNASEGMIHAVANEVDRRRTAMRPYGPNPAAAPARPSGAIVFNAVA